MYARLVKAPILAARPSKCSLFIVDQIDEDTPLCRCPNCKGWLPRDFPNDKSFTCKKCGETLITIPSHVEDPDDPEDTEYEFGGRICVLPDALAQKIKARKARPGVIRV